MTLMYVYIYTPVYIDSVHRIADPTRRRIIEALPHGERPVGELVGQAGIQQSGVSCHLRILSEAGFVSMRTDGQPFRELDS